MPALRRLYQEIAGTDSRLVKTVEELIESISNSDQVPEYEFLCLGPAFHNTACYVIKNYDCRIGTYWSIEIEMEKIA